MEAELRGALNAEPVDGWPAAGIVRDPDDGTVRIVLLSLRPLAHAPRTQRQAAECWRWLSAAATGQRNGPDGRPIPELPIPVAAAPVGLWLVGFDREDPLFAVSSSRQGKKWAPRTRYTPLAALVDAHPDLARTVAEVRWFLPRAELEAHPVLGAPAKLLRDALGRPRANQDGWSWVDRQGSMLAVLRGLQTLTDDYLELRVSGAGLDRWPSLEPEGLDDWARLDRIAARWLLAPDDVEPTVAELTGPPPS